MAAVAPGESGTDAGPVSERLKLSQRPCWPGRSTLVSGRQPRAPPSAAPSRGHPGRRRAIRLYACMSTRVRSCAISSCRLLTSESRFSIRATPDGNHPFDN